MIKHNQTFGISENITILEFGTGDICIQEEFDSTDKSITIAFRNLEQPLPIGSEIPNLNNFSPKELKQEIVLKFPTLESLDNIIVGLLKMRNHISPIKIDLSVKVLNKEQEKTNESI